MKVCGEHIRGLKKALEDRGLWRFVAVDIREANRRARALSEHGLSKETYDPMMGAVFQVAVQAVHRLGEVLCCPLCEVNRRNPIVPGSVTAADHWIQGACDDQLAVARRIGLMEIQ